MPKILITNDDGIESKGLEALYDAASTFGDVYVFAPSSNQSATGHSLTLTRPLRVKEIRKHWFSVDGTPTDCVNVALNGFLEDRTPDLILSGINIGTNLGDDVTYSGTIAAAMEGTLLGISSVAISQDCEEKTSTDFGLAKKSIIFLAQKILNEKLPPRVFLNINVPNISEEGCLGIQITSQGKRVYGDRIVKRKDPRGTDYFWIGGDKLNSRNEPNTDFAAIESNQISITPVKMDLTDEEYKLHLKKWDFDEFI
tara:strand:- start:2813 stop:3577 length:765 start_codon:yes stop_codon:yes gene_type:complete